MAFKNQSAPDKFFYYLTQFSAVLVITIFAGILACLIYGSIPAIKAFGLHFLFDNSWNPVLVKFGASNAIAGTLISSAIALVLAVPVSFGVTVFILKIAPRRSRKYLRIAIDLLAGIPSIIYGIWGLFVLAPLIAQYIQPIFLFLFGNIPWLASYFSGPAIGMGLFTAGVVLGIMIIPFIASIMYEVFELVPNMLQESSYALGATTWETIWKVIVPYGRIGFIGGIMLGLGRALGETMAVAFVIGNAHTITVTLFSPANSMTSSLANEFTEATGPIYTSALVELALFLFLLTSTIIFLSRLLLRFLPKMHAN